MEILPGIQQNLKSIFTLDEKSKNIIISRLFNRGCVKANHQLKIVEPFRHDNFKQSQHI
jgi:hypothetical protein